MFDSIIFHTKVIHYEAALDGMPFVAPEARGGFSLVVAFSNKAGSEEIVGQNASLGKAIAAAANFEVDPTVAVHPRKLVFLNKSARISVILMWTYSGSGIGVSR